MRLVGAEDGELDSRKVAPADVADALEGLVNEGKVAECLLIVATHDGEMLLLNTDMTTTHLLGFFELAKLNYTHTMQHHT